MTTDRNEYQREYQNKRNSAAREITIRECADPKRRSDLLADPVDFLKWYFPGRFFRPFSDDQKETIQYIIESAKAGTDEIFAAPRGDWKTETAKGMVIHLLLSQVITFPVIIGATAEDARMKFEDIKSQFEKNDRLAADFPEVCDPVRALEGAPQKSKKQTFAGERTDFEWRSNYCTFPQIAEAPGTGKPSAFLKCAFTYRGLDGQIRGINIQGRRPDLAFCDDLETRESADSDHQIEIRARLLDNDVAGLAGGGESLARIVLGTVQNNKCLTFKKLNEWGGRQYKAVNKWPDDRGMALAEEYIEIRKDEKSDGSKSFDKSREFYRDNRLVIEDGVVVANEHCFSSKVDKSGKPFESSTFQRVLNNAADYNWNYVWCELQNDPPDDRKVETIGLTAAKIMTRVSGLEQKKSTPETGLVTAAIDLGKYACHWGVVDWIEGLTGRVSNYGVAEVHGTGTETDRTQTHMAIRSSLMRWREELLGGELCERKPDIVLIDSSDFTDVVYSFVKEVQDGSNTFFAIKGLSPYRTYRDIAGKTIAGHHWHANLQPKSGVWLYSLDSDGLKSIVHQMWATPTFDEAQQFSPLSLSLFSAFGPDGKSDTRRHMAFGKHQVAEEYREEFKPGKGMVRGWHKNNPNNHWLDVSYMNLAGALMKGMKPPFEPDPTPPPKRQQPDAPQNHNRRFGRRDKTFVAKRT